jgi:carbamate kinase
LLHGFLMQAPTFEPRVVVALSGDVHAASATEVSEALRPLLLGGAGVVLTHGNHFRNELGTTPSDFIRTDQQRPPLDRIVAMLEGDAGHLLAVALRTVVGKQRPVSVLLTHVRVDPTSRAFRNPTKLVGPAVSLDIANRLRQQGISMAAESTGDGLRRIVASPEPLEVLDVEILKGLVDRGAIVIAGGGGGIPVTVADHSTSGADVVVDKDLTAALIAEAVDADKLVLVTDVPCVFRDFGTAHRTPLFTITVGALHDLLAEGQFAPGSMAPKVEACVRFVTHTGRRAAICDLPGLGLALRGEGGTQVVAE